MSIGTTLSPRPSESVSVIELPDVTREVATGNCAATLSFGILGFGARSIVTVKSARSSLASLSVRPTTLGTVITDVLLPPKKKILPRAIAISARAPIARRFRRGIPAFGISVVIASPRPNFTISVAIASAL